MAYPHTQDDPQLAWDRAASAYNELRRDLGAHVSYGPFAPEEDELALLGPLTGRTVLDLGCGPGHNTVHFARREVRHRPRLQPAADRRGQAHGAAP